MPKTRVLVIEDSLTVRRRMCEVFSSAPDMEVVGEADNGKQGVELCGELRPDAVTLDMHLPVMSGLASTEYIMAYFPTPILIVSSSLNRGDLFKTYDALAAGAVDVLEKPTGDEASGEWERSLLSAVRMVARIKVITHPRARLGELGRLSSAPSPELARTSLRHGGVHLVAIGASTGGPGAIVEVLRGIPIALPVPVLIVLHIGDAFGAAFADWLGNQTPHPVVVAKDGDRLASLDGKVVMAPTGRHLVVRHGLLRLTSDPERHSCRPSVDVLFESLAVECPEQTLACLLTGMGRDGAAGLLAVRRAGGRTFAQDEATSIVYGMPREAALLGAVDRILPLGQIGAAVVEQLTRGAR